MSKIYNLFMIKRMTERWLQLSPADQSIVMAKIDAGLGAAGGRRVIACSAHWCNEGYRGWGVEEFPDFDSWRTYADLREKLEWYAYLDSWSLLGTWNEAVDPAEAVAPESGKVYQLFMMRGVTEAYEQLSQAEKDALWEREGKSRQAAKWVAIANCYWASEEYQGFGVIMHADIDAVQRHFANMEQVGWPRYMHGRSLLGTLWEA